MDILQIGASVSLDQFQAGLDRAEADTKHSAKGMSDAFRALAEDSEESTNKILAASVRVSEASIALAQSKDQVRAAMREAKAAGEDDVVALARLALAQKSASDAAKELAEAQAKLSGSAQLSGEAIQQWIEHPFQAASELAKSFAESLGPIGVEAFSTIAGVAALGAEAVHLTLEMAASVRQAQNMADRLGITTEQAQRLGAEAKLVGVDVNTMGMAARILGQVLDDPTSKQSANARMAIERLGVAMYTSSGQTRELGPVLLDVLNALSQITEDSTRAAVAQALFGRGGKELLPLIKNHQELLALVNELGVGLEEGPNKSLSKVFTSSQKLAIAWEELKKSFADKIAPIVIPVTLDLSAALSGKNFQPHQEIGSGPTLAERALNEAAKTDSAIYAQFKAKLSAQLHDFDAFAVGMAGATSRISGETLAAGFRASLGNSEEGLKQQLAAIKEERGKLEAVLSSGALSPEAFGEKKKEFTNLGVQQQAIEAKLKGVQRSREIRLQEIDATEADQKAQLEVERAGIEAEARLHEINEAGRLAKLAAVKAKERQIEENAIQQKIGVYRNDPQHPDKVEEMQGQLDAIRSKGTASAITSQSEILAAQIKAIENEVKEHDKAEQESRKIRDKEADDALKASLKIAADKDKAQDLELTGELAHQKSLNATRKEHADTNLAGGNITQAQHAKILADIENQEYASQKKILDARMSAIVAGSAGELAERQKVLNEELALEDHHVLELAKIDEGAAKKTALDWKHATDEINRDFENAFSAWIEGHKRFTVAFAQESQKLVAQTASHLLAMTLKWGEHEVMKLIQHLETNDRVVASDATAAAQTLGIGAASALKQLEQSAAAAAGKAYSAVVGIPVVGPVLGPAAAAAAFAGVMAFGALASAEGGMLVGDDQLAFLHKNEMVLPSQYSQTIQNITSNGGAGGGGGTVNIGMHFTDGAGARRFWSQGKNNIKSVVKEMVREGAFKKK
jgi:hypothetical protein